uniref:Uncharacterized protein n=1 Tax=Clandestinovirus TaxID=2831644 RepID=A0A8F8KQ11_9VIRU|nr:hypothetical protein KOM_12_417 [Clandestinovirus]
MWHAIEESLEHRVDPFDCRGWPWNIFACSSAGFMVDPLPRTFTTKTQGHNARWNIQTLAFTDPDGIPTLSEIRNAYLQLGHAVKDSSNASVLHSSTASIGIDELSITIEEFLAGLPMNVIQYLSVLHNSDDPLVHAHSLQKQSNLCGKSTQQLRTEDDFLRNCLGGDTKFPIFLSRWPGGKPHVDWLPMWQRLKNARHRLFTRFFGGLVRCILKISSRQHRKYKNRMVKARSSFINVLGDVIKKLAMMNTRGKKAQETDIILNFTKLHLPHGTHSCNWDFIRAIFDVTRVSLITRITITHNEPVWRREHPLSKHYNVMQEFLMQNEKLDPHPGVVTLTSLKEVNQMYHKFRRALTHIERDDYNPNRSHWKHVVRSLPAYGTGSRKTYFVFASSFK